jgi:alpha-L-glutamate ligase-like protein
MKLSSILGLNARTQLFAYKYNTKRGKNIADSKIQTARSLKNAGVPHPDIFKKFADPTDVFKFDWSTLPDRFALKPSRGMGGEGIIVVKRRISNKQSLVASNAVNKSTNNPIWITTNKERVTAEDLKLHVLDILEGAYSMGNVPDVAFVQEYIGRAEVFRKWAYRGTPDIRVIIFNKVPVMAMLRLPTRESGGRANLHQGALGLGIDIATGITTKAIWHGEQIVFKPGTERALRGIKIPNWDLVLTTAINASVASGLGYAGIDIVLHPEKGPMVLELNAQPGLQIQLANMEGLKKRLERVDDLDVSDAEHGVNLAKALFAGRFENRRALEEGIKTIKNDEFIKIVLPNKHKVEVLAKVDTGAWRSSIDKTFAQDNGLLAKENILWTKVFKSSLGTEKRPVINLSFYLAGRRIDTMASVANRSGLKKVCIIGRRDLQGFLVKVDDQAK